MSSVYIIGDGGLVKIGFADDPRRRLGLLQVGSSRPLTLHHSVRVPATHVRLIEGTAHLRLERHRVRGEWFMVSPETAMEVVGWAIERVNAPAPEPPPCAPGWELGRAEAVRTVIGAVLSRPRERLRPVLPAPEAIRPLPPAPDFRRGAVSLEEIARQNGDSVAMVAH